MADFVFNYAKGRAAEFYNRVKSNDPSNSALLVVALATTGLESDAILKDKSDLAAVLSGSTDEATNSGYSRKVYTDSDIVAFAVDTTNDRVDLALANPTWAAVQPGSGWSKILVCYDNDTTGGTDSNIVPLVALDVSIVPDGSDIQIQFNASGFFRAS